MDGRMRRFGPQASPERSKVWAEPPPKNRRPPQQGTRKVPVVYYLSRNRHLERPHFIEVPISSPDGLYLRDVIDRLNLLRGKGMPAIYSWSCKRSYKNGYVWHDLAEDDIVIPASGNEYILMGSELLGQSPSERLHHSTSSPQLQSPEHPRQEPTTSSRAQQAHSSSSSPVVVEARPHPPFPTTTQEDELSPTSYRRGSHPSPEKGSLGLVEYRVRRANGWADASTQTEDGRRRRERRPDTRQKGVSTDDEPLALKFKERHRNCTTCFNEGSENGRDEISPPPTASSASSPARRMNTLESLIRADASRMKDSRIFEEEEKEVLLPMKAKLKVANILMQLITCGSISLKYHHSFGPVLTYKPRFSCMKFPSQVLASSMVLGDLDFLSENPRVRGLRQEERRCCSGSMIETKLQKEEVGGRSTESPDSKRNEQKVVHSAHSKCLPRTTKVTSCKQSLKETMMSPMSDARNTSTRLDCSKSAPVGSSKGGGRRIADAFSMEGSSMSLESFKQGGDQSHGKAYFGSLSYKPFKSSM